MRRVFAIALAILAFTIVASDAMAQDSGESATDRLLEILKDRRIISEDEYGEIKALAESMEKDQAEMDRRLTDLDRSIADYLAKSGDAVGATVTYSQGMGFGFGTGDGLFALNLGGLFQFSYTGLDNDGYQDTNNFDVEENRIILQGHFFDPNLAFYMELDADGSVSLLDAYVDYNFCDYTNIRAGEFKIPYGRQNLTHESDRAFAGRGVVSSVFNLDRDTGIMFHDLLNLQEGGDAVMEYAVGFWNGEGRNSSGNDNNWLAWGARAAIYPFGYIDYVEGDWEGSQDVKFGLGGAYYEHENVFETETTAWEVDGVLTWNNLFLLAEYFDNEVDPSGSSSMDTDGWYAQAGYFLIPGQLEVIARYGEIDYDSDSMLDETEEWNIGVVYYWNGHHLKVGANFGEVETEYDTSGGGSYAEKDSDDIEYMYLRIWFQLEW